MICTKNVVESDLPEFVSLLTTLNAHIKDSTPHISSLQEKFGEVSRDDGMSYLETKCHLFLEYLIDVTYLMLIKMDGKSLEDYSCVERLVRTRTILEKIRPIDKKLTYQIDKLIKMASIESLKGDVHPLSFKPNVDDLITKEDSSGEENENNASTEKESMQFYVPPKVTAVPYDDDDPLSKKEKKLQKSKKQLLSKSLLEDLRTEYSEGPEEISSRRNSKRARIQVKEDERRCFEEDNLRRLTLTKKDKKNLKELNSLDEAVKIGSFRGINDEDDSSGKEEPYQAKKKKGKFQKNLKNECRERKK